MTAEAILPSAKPSAATEAFVMMETISTPGAISKVTSQLTAPSTTFVTFPFSTLRALIFMVAELFQTARGLAIELRFGCLVPKRSILKLLSRTRQAACRSDGHLVLIAVRAIPPGDGQFWEFRPAPFLRG